MNATDTNTAIYRSAGNNRMNNGRGNHQHVSYNTMYPYELELQQSSLYNQLSQLVDLLIIHRTLSFPGEGTKGKTKGTMGNVFLNRMPELNLKINDSIIKKNLFLIKFYYQFQTLLFI